MNTQQMSKKYINNVYILNKLNSVAFVRERTIPTERPPPVGEVISLQMYQINSLSTKSVFTSQYYKLVIIEQYFPSTNLTKHTCFTQSKFVKISPVYNNICKMLILQFNLMQILFPKHYKFTELKLYIRNYNNLSKLIHYAI
jgi:hypothetical protein